MGGSTVTWNDGAENKAFSDGEVKILYKEALILIKNP